MLDINKATYTGHVQCAPLSAEFSFAGRKEWIGFERLRMATQGQASDSVWQAYHETLDAYG